MLKVINSKILLSAISLLIAAVLVIGTTFAWFSDNETSKDNVFLSGSIDLKIDNTSYITNSNGVLTASENTSWDLRELTIEKFFNFTDLKPGDIGEDTISVHVKDNDSWVCAAARITDDSDQSCTDPENIDDLACSDPDGEGELDNELNFAFWKDDGDNVLEDDEDDSIFLNGSLSNLNPEGKIALADSSGDGPFGNNPITGDTTFYIGKAWCFGVLSINPVTQDGVNISNPILRGTGFVCNGEGINNAAQTDQIVGDIQFYAIQSRNNDKFTCAKDYTPDWQDESERPFVGADLARYVQPEGSACDVNVTDIAGNGEIQIGINSAIAGNTVCVGPGTYNENLIINKGITLAGDGPTATSTINGNILIEADNATLEGFEINGPVKVKRYTDTRIAFNKITVDPNIVNISGIVYGPGNGGVLVSSGQAIVEHNVVSAASGRGIYFDQNGVPDFWARNNTVNGRGAIGYGSQSGGTIEKCVLDSIPVTGWDVGTYANKVNVNTNNLSGRVLEADGSSSTPMNAKNNWWGQATGPAVGQTTGDVDSIPFETSPYQEY